MPAIGFKGNRQPLNRTFVEINKEDEIGLARFLRDFKELPKVLTDMYTPMKSSRWFHPTR
jgi:hypothetical protein